MQFSRRKLLTGAAASAVVLAGIIGLAVWKGAAKGVLGDGALTPETIPGAGADAGLGYLPDSEGLSGKTVRFQSLNYPQYYLADDAADSLVYISQVAENSDSGVWIIRPALNGGSGYSFESAKKSGFYLRHQNYRMKLHENDGSQLFLDDSSFILVDSLADRGAGYVSLQSSNYPDYLIRHKNFQAWIDPKIVETLYEEDSSFRLIDANVEAVELDLSSFFGKSIKLESLNYPGLFLGDRSYLVNLLAPGSDNVNVWKVRPGLNGQGISLESASRPGFFLRHQNFRVKVHPDDGSQLFKDDTSFTLVGSVSATGSGYISLQSTNYPEHLVRHRNFEAWIDPRATDDLYLDDTSFQIVVVEHNEVEVDYAEYLGKTVLLKSLNYPDLYLTPSDGLIFISQLPSGVQNLPLFTVRKGLNGQGITLESVNTPGFFLRHQDFRVKLHASDDSQLFKDDSSFLVINSIANRGAGFVSFQSTNFPEFFIRHKNFEAWIDPQIEETLYQEDASFKLVVYSSGYGQADASSLIGKTIRFQSLNYPSFFLALQNGLVDIVDAANDDSIGLWNVRPGLNGRGITLESAAFPGYFLRHQDFRVKLHQDDGSQLFKDDSSFVLVDSVADRGAGYISLQSTNYPSYLIRHKWFQAWIDPQIEETLYEEDSSFKVIVVGERTPVDVSGLIGKTISLKSLNYGTYQLAESSGLAYIIDGANGVESKWIVREGLNGQGITLESSSKPGFFLRHQNFRVKIHSNDGSQLFKDDSSFIVVNSVADKGAGYISFQSTNYPDFLIRHKWFEAWIDPKIEETLYEEDSSFKIVVNDEISIVDASFYIGQTVKLQSLNYPSYFLKEDADLVYIKQSTGDLTAGDWKIRPGLNGKGISLESTSNPGYFLRHQNFRVKLHQSDGTQLFKDDTSFVLVNSLSADGSGFVSLQSTNYPTHLVRHRNFEAWIDPRTPDALYQHDTSFKVVTVPDESNVADTSDWIGRTVRLQSLNYPEFFLGENSDLAYIIDTSVVAGANVEWKVVSGLNGNGISFESVNKPGFYLRHQDFRVKVHQDDGSQLFKDDTSFLPINSIAVGGAGFVSFQSSNYPEFFIRHKNFEAWIDPKIDQTLFEEDASFRVVFEKDVSGLIGKTVELQSLNYPEFYLTEEDGLLYIRTLPGQWIIRSGLNGRGITFESASTPGLFVRHQNFRVKLHSDDGSQLFKDDSSFLVVDSFAERGQGYISLQSTNYPEFFIRHQNFEAWIHPKIDETLYEEDASFLIITVE